MSRKHPRPEPVPVVPAPRTAMEHVAKQTGTDAADWIHVTRNSTRYKAGFRYWHQKLNLYAKRTDYNK